MQKCIQHNEGKSVVSEKSIRTLKNKTYNYKTSISKNEYIDKLDDIINEYNNTYHRTIKMKLADVKDLNKEVNDKDPKFQVGDHVRTSKFKKHFCSRIYSKLVSTNFCNIFHVITDNNGEETIWTFYEKELQKINQEEYRIEKTIKKETCQMEKLW